MDIERLFPFYREAKFIKSYRVKDFDLYAKNYIFEPETNEFLANTINDYFSPHNIVFKFYRIMPNDVYVFAGQDTMKRFYVSSEKRPKTVQAQITEIDYGLLINHYISIDTIDGEKQAIKKCLGGYDIRPLADSKFIEDAMLGESSEIECLGETVKFLLEESRLNKSYIRNLSEHLVTEALSDFGGPAPIGSYKWIWNDQPYLSVLKHYFSNLTPTEKIPLLVGISGIAKSATIEELADQTSNQWGKYRLTDLRVSFLSRLDVDGMKEVRETGEGENLADKAPTTEFLTCTDEYLEFARGMIPKLEKRVETLERESAAHTSMTADTSAVGFLGDELESEHMIREKRIGALSKMINKFREAARTPVLFLDEITRSDRAIRGVLATLINARLYGSYHLNECRIVAATNAPVGYSERDAQTSQNPVYQEYFIEHFLGNDLEDVAILDRFDKLRMTPEDVYPDWQKWAKGEKDNKPKGGKIHDAVMTFIEKNGDLSAAYDLTPIADPRPKEEEDAGLDMPVVHSTFRAWTSVSDYLYNQEKTPDKKGDFVFSKALIQGLIGQRQGEQFATYLSTEFQPNWKKRRVSADDDPMGVMIEDSLENNLPLSIIGASGLGKTARVMSYARDRNYAVELIPLSTKTRNDIMGLPSTVSVLEYIAGQDSALVEDDEEFYAEMKELQEESKITMKLTRRAPDSDLKERIKECIANNRPLVLFFDEFNRSIDPVTQTAVFQAISNNEFAGVKFPKGLIKVILAGNPGDEDTCEAGEVDAALIARGVHYRQLGYSKKDVESFLNYAKKTTWNELSKNKAESIAEDESIKIVTWEKPSKEKEAYKENALVEHKNKFWQSAVYNNMSEPGEWTSGYSRVLIEYLEQDPEKVLEIIKSIEKASVDFNVSSTRSLKMLSDILDNYSQDNTLNGTVLLPDEIDRNDFSMRSHGNDETFIRILKKMKKNMPNWSARNSNVKYVTDQGTFDLEAVISEWDPEVEEYIKTQQGDREAIHRTCVNFLQIDFDLIVRRQQLLETKVDKEFAEGFLAHYNAISGHAKHTITIIELKNDETLIDDFVGQEIRRAGGIDALNWNDTIVEVWKECGSEVSPDGYVDLLARFIDEETDPTAGGMNRVKLILEDKTHGVPIFKHMEFQLIKELEANNYDFSVLANHKLYKIISTLRYDNTYLTKFLESLSKATTTASSSAAGLHGLGQ